MTPPGREKFDFIDLSSLKTSEEKFKYLLKFAVLAPSAHNVQPWAFKI
jgi:nitroreductase